MALQENGEEVINWAEELDEKLEGPRLPGKTVKHVGDRRIVTEWELDPDTNQKKKNVYEYRIITKRVPRAVAVRKNWKKFGDCEQDPVGPQTRNTVVSDEIPMQFITGREDVMGSEAPTMGLKGDKAQVTCRICGGDHWTSQCQFQGSSEAEKEQIREKFLSKKEGMSMDAGPSEGGGQNKAYVAPGRRMGSNVPSSSMQQESFPSVRVSNLPSVVEEQDLRNIFERFGRIKKVYLGKDKKTGEFKGFAFVTFTDQHSADAAIAAVNGHKYFHMILSVDWANPSRN